MRVVHALWITCAGYDPFLMALTDPSAGTGELVRLRPSRRWAFEVVDASTGAPVGGAALSVGMDTSPSPELPAAVSVRVDAVQSPEHVRGNRIALDSAWLRWSERWTLQASAPGFRPWTRATTAAEMRAGPDVVRVALEPAE